MRINENIDFAICKPIWTGSTLFLKIHRVACREGGKKMDGVLSQSGLGELIIMNITTM